MRIAIITKLSVSGLAKRWKKGDAAKHAAMPSEETKSVKQEENRNKGRSKTSPLMLKAFTEDYIRGNSLGLKNSTLNNYRCAVNSFLRFRGVEDAPFSLLTAPRVEEFEHWLDAHSVSPNTASAYMRSLRALYNKAPLGRKQM